MTAARFLAPFAGAALPVALVGLVLVAGCPPDAASGDDDDDDDDNPAARFVAGDVEELARALADDAFGGRDENTQGGNDARTLLIGEIEACGLAPAGNGGTFEQAITTGEGTNILARVEGTDQPERVIIVSAHYDHVGSCGGQICNGAYDNAAGVSAAVQVACAIADAPLEKTVLLALWDAEEPPTFLTDAMGSEFFAASGLVPLDTVDAVLVLDLVGGELWPGYGKHFVMGAEKSPELSLAIDSVVAPDGLTVMRGGLHLVENTPLSAQRQPWSDYDAFRNRDVPIAFFSDGQNKLYHTVDDEADTLDYDKLALESEHLYRVIEAISSEAATFTFDPAAEELGRDADTVLDILNDALADGGLVDTLGLSEESRDKLRGTQAAIEAGSTGVETLRSGALRVMCYAGTSFEEAGCNFF
jgi:hypothetical protein